MVLLVNLSILAQVCRNYICILFSGTADNRIANFMEGEHMEQITRVQIQESLDAYVKTYITDAEWHISLVEDFMHLLTGNSFNVTDLQDSRWIRTIIDNNKDDEYANYGLDLVYLNKLGAAKLIIDGIRETEEFVDGLIALQCARNFNLFDELTEQILDNDDLRLSFTKTITTAILDKKLGFVSGRHKDGTVDWGIAVVPDGGIYDCDPNDLLAIPIIDNSSYKTQHELHQQLGPERICNAIFESVVTNLFDTNNRKGALAFLDALGMKFNVIPKKVSEFETADDEDADESSMFSEI